MKKRDILINFIIIVIVWNIAFKIMEKYYSFPSITEEQLINEKVYEVKTGFGLGLINNKGQLVEGYQKNRISYQDGMFIVKEKGKLGIKNINDEWVVQPVYDYIEHFRDGNARVGIKDGAKGGFLWYIAWLYNYGLVDLKGNIIYEVSDNMSEYLGEGLVAFINYEDPNKVETVLDLKGNIVRTTDNTQTYPFSENRATIYYSESNYYGYINTNGDTIIEAKYSSVDDFSNGIAIVKDGINGFGAIDPSGQYVLKPKYKRLESYGDGLIAFTKKESPNILLGFMDINENIIIEPQFESTKPFSEGLAAVSIVVAQDSDGNEITKWGFVNKKGEMVIKPQYEKAESFKNGLARVTKKISEFTTTAYIDQEGKVVWKSSWVW